MKKYWLIFLVCLATAVSHADTITLWDFDYPAVPVGTFGNGDGNTATGTYLPNGGSGSITNIGGTTNSFGTPPAGGATATSDGDVSDNTALRLGQFPASTTVNKTAGIQLFTSTVGYQNIMLTFDQENSATASKYWRVQYTIDGGTNWVDFTSYTTPGSTAWVLARNVDFSAVTGVPNNPNFGVRIVSEFQSTATGSGTVGYVGNSSGYGTSGTLWVDMVTISGTVFTVSSNTPPTITAISSETVGANKTTPSVPFTVDDAETPASQLTVTATSGNESLIADSDVHLSGSGGNYTFTVTPEANQYGSAQITIAVTDGGGLSASSLFNVIVAPPTVIVTNETIRVGNNASENFQITGLDSFLGAVTVTADSTNTDLLPDSNISFSGSGTNRIMTLTPVAGQVGATFVTVTASDGSLTATNSFYLHVVTTNTIALWDFNGQIFDANASTGTFASAIGSGSITNCGTATNSLNSTINVTNSDLETLDNSKLRFGAFPTQATGNKTSGVEMHISTLGYQNIAFSLDHYNSASASRYYRVQYSLDGSNYVDFIGYSNNLVTTFFNTNFSFGAIAGANNNSNFAVRVVSEFESTAIGTANANYDAVTNGYSSGGTLWIDDVDFTGDVYVPGANTPPTITAIPDQTINANATVTLPFIINDAQTAPAMLTVSAVSANLTLIAASDISFGGSGTNRTIIFHPEADQLGSSQITVTVADADGGTNSTTFNVTVQSPTVSLTNQTLFVNTSATAQLDVSGFLATPTITVDSSNTAVVVDNDIVVTGSGASRTLTVTPLPDQLGASLIVVTVSNATFVTTNAFYVHFVPTNTIALWDFNSPVFDLNGNTGNLSPAFGAGTATSIGGATNSLGTLNASAMPIDPETLDNSEWRFGAFPANSTANKTAGAQFHVSTAGHQNIKLSYEHYNSATASEYWRVQYSLDGSTYTDFTGYGNTLVTTLFPVNIDFSSITGANNNPNFAVRLVSEFQSTATGSGADVYAAVGGGGYSTGGTLWLDDVDFTGDVSTVVVQPSLSVSVVTGGSLSISWPTSATGAVLQSTPTLNPANWQNVTQTPTVQGGQNVVTISTATGNQYFRLVH